MFRLIPFTILLTLLLAFSACTTTVNIRVTKPADITIKKDIQSIILLNRYRPDPSKKENIFVNILEGILTGEGLGTDRRGTEACLEGLSNILYNSLRFEASRPSVELKGSGWTTFPEALPSSVVQEICAQHDSATGAVIIEAFDSNSNLSFKTTSDKKKDKNGNEYTVTTHHVTANVNVTVGWRFYEAHTGSIIDQYRMFETVQFRAKGRSKQLAIANLPAQDAIIQRIGRVLGDAYARRISPASLWVNRHIYSGGNADLRRAKRLGDLRKWKKAADIWEGLVEHKRAWVAKRAAYNMAVASEIFGDFDTALDWTEHSYTMGLNPARDYNRILHRRIREERILDHQLNLKEESDGQD